MKPPRRRRTQRSSSPIEITVENCQRRTPLSEKKLAQSVARILGLLGWNRVRLGVRVVTDAQIQKLHRRFLGEDSVTDVLAFSQMEGKTFPQKGTPFLGDVVVSIETARRAAPEFGNRWDEELLFYLCHGVLHLMGYRDSSPAKRALMHKKQETLLKKALGKLWRSKKRKLLF